MSHTTRISVRLGLQPRRATSRLLATRLRARLSAILLAIPTRSKSNTVRPSRPHFLDALRAHEYGTTRSSSSSRSSSRGCLVELVGWSLSTFYCLVFPGYLLRVLFFVVSWCFCVRGFFGSKSVCWFLGVGPNCFVLCGFCFWRVVVLIRFDVFWWVPGASKFLIRLVWFLDPRCDFVFYWS